jgi:CyaY protein
MVVAASMTETEYLQAANRAFRAIEDGLRDIDADDVDVERSGDVLSLGFRSGVRCVINTQRPTRQLWMAANARAWHFDWDSSAGRWVDDKGRGELFATLAGIVREHSGIEPSFAP